MSLQSRLERLEESTPPSALQTLRAVGMDEERIDEVLTRGGIEWDTLTDDELRAIAGDPDEEIRPGVTWGELTIPELERIAEGEPVDEVLR